MEHQRAGVTSDDFLSNALKCYFRLSGFHSRGTWVFANLLEFFFCRFLENPRSYCLSQNYSCLFFGAQKDIFINPKATGITFLVSRKFEVAILLRKSEGCKRPSEQTQFTVTIHGVLMTSALQN